MCCSEAPRNKDSNGYAQFCHINHVRATKRTCCIDGLVSCVLLQRHTAVDETDAVFNTSQTRVGGTNLGATDARNYVRLRIGKRPSAARAFAVIPLPESREG